MKLRACERARTVRIALLLTVTAASGGGAGRMRGPAAFPVDLLVADVGSGVEDAHRLLADGKRSRRASTERRSRAARNETRVVGTVRMTEEDVAAGCKVGLLVIGFDVDHNDGRRLRASRSARRRRGAAAARRRHQMQSGCLKRGAGARPRVTLALRHGAVVGGELVDCNGTESLGVRISTVLHNDCSFTTWSASSLRSAVASRRGQRRQPRCEVGALLVRAGRAAQSGARWHVATTRVTGRAGKLGVFSGPVGSVGPAGPKGEQG